MEQIAGDGRTVLMVSHNTHAVRSLCDSAIMLNAGRVLYFGDTDRAIQLYDRAFSHDEAGSRVALHERPRACSRDPRIKICAIDFGDKRVAVLDQPFSVEIEVEVSEPVAAVFGLGFSSRVGSRILTSDSDYSDVPVFALAPGKHRIKCAIENLPLWPGDYLLDVGCRSTGLVIYDEVKEACSIEVSSPKSARPQLLQKYPTCLLKASWGKEAGDAGA